MFELKELLVILVLGYASYLDIRYNTFKKHQWLFLSWIPIGILSVMQGADITQMAKYFTITTAYSLFFFYIVKFKQYAEVNGEVKETYLPAIGGGDGKMIMGLSLAYPSMEIFMLLLLASIFGMIYQHAVLSRIKDKRFAIPFVPFVFVSVVLWTLL